MTRPFDFVTFDCYGTLVDWRGGICGAFSRVAEADGYRLDEAALLEAHAEIEPIVQAGVYRSYREVLQETTRRIAQRFEWPMSEEKAGFLANSMENWSPFPDTRAALRRLTSAGCRLGILSNVDDDLLTHTLRRLEVRFDLLVTAQDVRSYKPSAGHFHAARERIGDANWLHVAQSLFHDVEPAGRLGIPAVWINRLQEPAEGPEPLREFCDLTQLADWLAPPAQTSPG